MNDRVVTLGLETGVGAGSVACLIDGVVAASTLGRQVEASRAENLLIVLKEVLERAGISTADVDQIAVSAGPGSYSGLRIGWATALGLAAAIGSSYIGVPLLDAIASESTSNSSLLIALPVGKRDVAWRLFEFEPQGPRPSGPIAHGSRQELVEICAAFDGQIVVTESELTEALQVIGIAADRIRAFEETAAAAVARFSRNKPMACVRQPIYIRDLLDAPRTT